ncbi:MAG: hypothetical protein ACOC44_16150 [Promethearchaeia archaeon]
MGQVEYKGNVYKSIGDRLDLSNLGVRDLNQIYALQDLKDIKELDPSNNRIAEIEGFASLRQLEVLNLKLNQRIR